MQSNGNTKGNINDNKLEIISFSNQTSRDKKLLKTFVQFPWDLYADDPQFIPLFDYEYLGLKIAGIVGFFEPRNLFFKHAEMTFFLALKGDEVVGRCLAFINHNHNKHWNDKVGFFGHFESIDDPTVADALIESAKKWLKDKGMDTIRGPQNMPVNEATPGFMTDGFDSRPVIYYNYNKPYYEKLMNQIGFGPIKRVFSWEVPVMNPMEEKLVRVAQKVIERFDITIETWKQRPLAVRKKEMLEIYNDAWDRNFGFIPFTQEEWDSIIDGMALILDKGLYQFIYVKGEPAAFLGGVPNINERMRTIDWCPRCEILRLLKLFFTKGSINGFRLGYLGVKKKFQHLGLDGVMIWKQKIYSQKVGLDYTDLGWVLDDNIKTIRLIDMMGGKRSKTYTIFEQKL